MKSKMLFLILAFAHIFCTFANNDKDIEFKITNLFIKDGLSISLMIKNNSNINYYLPILTNVTTEKWSLIATSEERKFFFINKVISEGSWNLLSINGPDLSIRDEEVYLRITEWKQKRKSLNPNEFIRIKAKDSLIVEVPFNLVVPFSASNICQLPTNNGNLSVQLKYCEHNENENEWIGKELIESFKNEGYQIYRNKITSNEVRVFTDTTTYLEEKENERAERERASIERKQMIENHIDFPRNSLQKKYFYFCIKELMPLARDTAYNLYPIEEMCSLEKCFSALIVSHFKTIVYERLKEIAQYFYNKNIHLELVSGSGSRKFAEQKNKNRKDNNGIIYISVNDFCDIVEFKDAVAFYNAETKKLMKTSVERRF